MPAKTKNRRRKNKQQSRKNQSRKNTKVVSNTRTPFEILHLRKKKCYSVRRKNKRKPKIFSKCTTKEKAESQMRLLRAIIYNKTFRKRR